MPFPKQPCKNHCWHMGHAVTDSRAYKLHSFRESLSVWTTLDPIFQGGYSRNNERPIVVCRTLEPSTWQCTKTSNPHSIKILVYVRTPASPSHLLNNGHPECLCSTSSVPVGMAEQQCKSLRSNTSIAVVPAPATHQSCKQLAANAACLNHVAFPHRNLVFCFEAPTTALAPST